MNSDVRYLKLVLRSSLYPLILEIYIEKLISRHFLCLTRKIRVMFVLLGTSVVMLTL